MLKIANVYDDEVDAAVGALTAVIEPIMIVFLRSYCWRNRDGHFPSSDQDDAECGWRLSLAVIIRVKGPKVVHK